MGKNPRKAILLALTMLFLASAETLYAGIGAEPTIIEKVVSPASVTKGVYKVVNGGVETVRVKVQVEDWLKKKTGKENIPIEDWLTIEPMEFDVEPQGMVEVDYKINPPAGTEGELVAMVFFVEGIPTEGVFSITTRFGVSIYAAIEGTIDLNCDINSMHIKRNVQKDAEGRMIDKGLLFFVDIENHGNTHLRPTGEIIITGEDGGVYDVEIGRGFAVYPGSHVNYGVRWDKTGLPAGKYDALIKLDYGKLYGTEKIIERGITFTIEEDGEISF